MEEARIYYECLEQAYFYLKPIVERVVPTDIPIKLIEISRANSESVIANALAAALAIRNPDGIISLVADGVEIPLAWIEFTTQVKTKDHAFQGFNSLVAAGEQKIPFIKFVAERRSKSEHGGAEEFDSKIPFQLLHLNYETPGIQLEWPTTEDSLFAVRSKDHLACPDRELGLEEILREILLGLEDDKTAAEALKEFASSGRSHLSEVLASHLTDPAPFIPSPRSTRFYKDSQGEWVIKFNRWAHSMDPERGMAELQAHWLKTRLIGRIHDSDANDINSAVRNFERGTGIRFGSRPLAPKMNITEEILASSPNRAGLIVIWWCKRFVIADEDGNDIVEFFWDVEKPEGLKVEFQTSEMTSLRKKEEVTEDDVTFVIANRFLPSNGFQVQSVSYPGAQGDFALLEGSGRKTKRNYFDVIAVKKLDETNLVSLIESKGLATASVIEDDLKKVVRWRDESSLRKQLLEALGLEGESRILSGLAYSAPAPIQASGAKDLDFVVLVDEQEWVLWAPYKAEIPGLKVHAGKSDLPVRFRY